MLKSEVVVHGSKRAYIGIYGIGIVGPMAVVGEGAFGGRDEG